jgi:hypothetical protein
LERFLADRNIIVAADELLSASSASAPENCQTAEVAEPNGHTSVEEQAVKPARRRGRPKGSIDPDVLRRRVEMLEAWDRGEFKSKAAAAEAFGFHRSNVSKLIDEYESEKRINNSRP